MAQRSNVPKFGNWESGENVPYTAYFDRARKGRGGGKAINPNDPEYNPDAFMDDVPPVRAPPFRTSSDPEVPVAVAASKPKQVRHLSGEDGGEFRRPVDSPARRDIGGRKAVNDSPQRYDRGGSSANPPRGGSRLSGTSDRSIEHSPLHPHYQARAVNKGSVNSPSWERKGSSEGGRGSSHGVAPSNPARPKLRSVNDETPERGPAVPKFGEWDESNPASADGFTHIFNKVREEKQTGAAKVPVISTESSSHNGNNKDSSHDFGPVKCCCFSFSRK